MKKTSLFLFAVSAMSVVVGAYFFFGTPNKKMSPSAPRVEVVDDSGRAVVEGWETVVDTEQADFEGYDFNDGLGRPDSKTKLALAETEAGIVSREVFNKGKIKITRMRFETGTAHGFFEYKIELDGADVTPREFRTVEGADCALQKMKFYFAPEFQIVQISRPWQDSWITPTIASRTIYKIVDGRLAVVSDVKLHAICDVSELF